MFDDTGGLTPDTYPMKYPYQRFTIITLWQFNIAIENSPLIVDFPMKNGDFP